MAEFTGFQPERFTEVESSELFRELNGQGSLVAIPDRSEAGLELSLPVTASACVRLALEELMCFEVVEDQFKHWGLTFANAIAIKPSNPAFLVSPDTTVLMGAPKSGLIEIVFKYPVRFASGFVTSSRRTVLSAFDAKGNLIDQAELAAPNLVGSNSAIPPNCQLKVSAPNIYQISFYAFDGQLIVNNFTFEF